MVYRRIKLVECIEQQFGAATRPEIIKFAEFLGVSEGAVVKWILRDRRPRYHTMKRIAKLTEGRMGIDDW